ncbi:hypothetical protein [Rhodopseudomonas sp. BR0M22]|uniref:hypothetical protein n=1 Tax=Rhodopseudomonas sp. BR0M22 TaxID=2269369 RepID=UPI0013DF379C|nr:hypothetical protein [Rhodopseudomonas sp. BR0M22]
MRDNLGTHDTAIEDSLHGHSLALRHRVGVLASRPEIDQRAAASIVENKLVTVDLRNATLDRHGLIGLHLIDGGWRQQHHALRLPVLRELHAPRACRCPYDENRQRDAAEKAAMTREATYRQRGVRIVCISVIHGPSLVSEDGATLAGPAQSSLNRFVQFGLI